MSNDAKSATLDYFDHVIETGDQMDQVMREYRCLMYALVRLVKDSNPEWSRLQAYEEARRLYRVQYDSMYASE